MSLPLSSANVSIVGSARYRYFHGRSLFACRFALLLILLIIYESLRMGATFLPLHMFNLFKFSQAISACLGIKSPENFSFTLIRKYLQQLIINADKQGANKSREHITFISGRFSAFLLRNRTPFLRADI